MCMVRVVGAGARGVGLCVGVGGGVGVVGVQVCGVGGWGRVGTSRVRAVARAVGL